MQKQDKNFTDSISMKVPSSMLSMYQELPNKKFVHTKGAESTDFSKTILIQIYESIGLLRVISLSVYVNSLLLTKPETERK